MASSKREKELARQRAERQAARRAAAAARKRQRTAVVASVLAVSLVAAGLVAAGFALSRDDGGGDNTLATDTSPAPLASAVASAAPSAAGSTAPSAAATAAKPPAGGTVKCAYEKTGEPAAKEVDLPPTEDVETKQVFAVTISTDRGDIVFDMDSAQAPCTANNLRSLAHFTYFDDTPCHRLTTEGIQVLQCGDPTGTGSGGPGYQFADENLEGATYERGTVAMANAGAGTNGSQFFLVYGDSTLPPNYTPFGKITAGLDVLDEVAKGGSDGSNGAGDGKPKVGITIKTLRAKPKAA